MISTTQLLTIFLEINPQGPSAAPAPAEYAHGHLGVDPGGAFGLRVDLVPLGGVRGPSGDPCPVDGPVGRKSCVLDAKNDGNCGIIQLFACWQ